ncbi:PKD domain-containing protein [Candidatus Gracilibacteria bacterium]|nr:PKD domain-containing protein [Candidatus Gracilibacteria bacterium]
MLFNRPTTPETPQKTKTPGFWAKIMSYTANDKDFIEPIKITKVVQKKKPKHLWKNIRSALIIIVTFYVMLCAFVLMNPQYALFFNNILGVQYLTIRTILEYTIYTVYSMFGIALGSAFLFFGYRAMSIRTKNHSKKTNIWIITAFFCILFFSNIALFAWTYDWFRKIDFGNLDGRVIVYDNKMLKYIGPGEDVARAVIDPNISIGPIDVRYDLNGYVKKLARLEGFLFTQEYEFEIDYNGDGDADRGSGKSNGIEYPITDFERTPIIAPEFSYDAIGEYAPTATIRGIDVGGKPITLKLELPKIKLEHIVKIGRTNLSNGGIQYNFDASALNELGRLRWSVLDKSSVTHDGVQFSPEKIFEAPTIICLRIFRGEAPLTDECNWKFVTEETTKSNIQNTDITIKIDSIDPLKYQFSVDPRAIQGEISAVRWFINDSLYVGKFDSGFERIFDYRFHDPGTYKIETEIEDTLGNIVRVGTEPVYTAELVDLKDGYSLQITNDEGANLDKNTYDKKTQSYLLPDFPVPGILAFDATGVRANSPRLRLEKVEWDKDNDGIYETEGFTLDRDIQVPGRYDIRARYTFTDLSIDGNDIPIYHLDRIAVVGVQKAIDVRVLITPDDAYAPANVRFDASGSKIQKGDIRKFIYDFGDGKNYEGEGVVTTYRYEKPGEYQIVVTAVTDKGVRASKKYTLILKKPQEIVRIAPSIASGLAQSGLPITFEAAIKGLDSVVTWNMGDGSGIKNGKSIVHEFSTPGTYTIKVSVQYASGIEETDTISYVVQ